MKRTCYSCQFAQYKYPENGSAENGQAREPSWFWCPAKCLSIGTWEIDPDFDCEKHKSELGVAKASGREIRGGQWQPQLPF